MRLMAAGIAVLVALAAQAAPCSAQSSPDIETLTDKEVPRTVASRLQCKSPSGPVTRRAFSGGFVFIQACADSAEALVRIVFANDRDGANARLLQFHRPEGRRMSALATAAFHPAENEISGSTLRLTRRICRAEGRWRMEGKQPAPGLVYWRQTRDCDGKAGWQTVIRQAASLLKHGIFRQICRIRTAGPPSSRAACASLACGNRAFPGDARRGTPCTMEGATA